MAPKGQTVEQKRAKALTWFKKQKTFFHMKVLTALTIKAGLTDGIETYIYGS